MAKHSRKHEEKKKHHEKVDVEETKDTQGNETERTEQIPEMMDEETLKKLSEDNKEKINIINNKNYEINKEKRNLQNKKWKEKNINRDKELKKNWYEKNKKSIREKIKKRKEEDPLFKLKTAISSRIRNGIKSQNFSKNFKTKEILGCTYEEFKLYIESKFESWMTWDNYGKYNGQLNYGWDLDHIIPIHISKTEDDIIKLNHNTNFQPLCSKINRDIKRHNY